MPEPSAPTKRMAEILGAQFVPKEPNPTTKRSQVAREDEGPIADAARMIASFADGPMRRNVYLAASDVLARFERDTEKRVRESVAGDAEMAAFGASDAACYLYPGGDQQSERVAFCAGASHNAARESLAGEVDAETAAEIEHGEKMRIVAWLRAQSGKGADAALEADEGSTRRSAFGGGSLALKRAADAIEADEHCTLKREPRSLAGEANVERVMAVLRNYNPEMYGPERWETTLANIRIQLRAALATLERTTDAG